MLIRFISTVGDLELLTSQHSGAGPATLAPLVHPAKTGKDILLVDTRFLGLTQLIRKDVQHQLAITVGVDVTMGFQIEIPLQLGGIDQISIVGQANAVRTIYIERLSLGICTASRSWISQMTNTHRTWKICDFGTVVEDFGSHAVRLQLVNSTAGRTGCNTSGILTSIYRKQHQTLAI